MYLHTVFAGVFTHFYGQLLTYEGWLLSQVLEEKEERAQPGTLLGSSHTYASVFSYWNLFVQ